MIDSVLVLLAALSSVASAGSCSTVSACVIFGSGCRSSPPQVDNKYVAYKPDCSGHCYQYDHFDAIQVWGDGAKGTRCHIYADFNCQGPELVDTKNQIGGSRCHTFSPAAKSMKCYYAC